VGDLRLKFVTARENAISARCGCVSQAELFEPHRSSLVGNLGVETGLAPEAMLPHRRCRKFLFVATGIERVAAISRVATSPQDTQTHRMSLVPQFFAATTHN